MKCSSCQFENSPQAKFCAKCGNSLQSVTPAPVPQPAPSVTKKLMPVEDLFKKSWELYQKAWLNLLLVSLISVAAWKVWLLLVMPAIVAIFGVSALVSGNLSLGLGIGLTGVATALLSSIVVFEIGFWGSAAGIVALIAAEKGQTPRLGEIYSEAKRLLWPLSIVSLLVFLAVGFGLLFLVIPGLILFFLLSFVSFVVVVEGKTGTAALERSIKLIWGNFLGVLGRDIIIILAIGMVNLFFGRVLLFSVISQTIVLPFVLVYHYLIYKDLATGD